GGVRCARSAQARAPTCWRRPWDRRSECSITGARRAGIAGGSFAVDPSTRSSRPRRHKGHRPIAMPLPNQKDERRRLIVKRKRLVRERENLVVERSLLT